MDSGPAIAPGRRCLLGLLPTASAAAHVLTVAKSPIDRAGTVKSDLTGISCGTDCEEDFPPEQICGEKTCIEVPQFVELTATGEHGFAPAGWTGCSGSADACTVTMNAAKSVTAHFADVTDPTVALTAPSGATHGGTIVFRATANDNWLVDEVNFRVRGALVASDGSPPYSASFDTAEVADGIAQVTAEAVDAAGRKSTDSISIGIDNTPPETTIDSGPADGSSSQANSAAFALSASEPGSTFLCRFHPAALPPPAWGPCSEPAGHSVSGLAPGTYIFEASATDALGNADPTPARRTFTVLPALPPGGGGAAAAPTGLGPAAGGEAIKAKVKARWRQRRGKTAVRKLIVRGLPRDAVVRVLCRGGGCAFRTERLRPKGTKVKLAKLFKARELVPGALIRITVTDRAGSGKEFRYRIRRGGKPPKALAPRCLGPGSAKPRRCA